jgi:uncharacterized Zn finger protein
LVAQAEIPVRVSTTRLECGDCGKIGNWSLFDHEFLTNPSARFFLKCPECGSVKATFTVLPSTKKRAEDD